MSQATLLGLCSDNVVTILQPSSTIECSSFPCGGTYTDISDISGTYSAPILLPSTGNAFVTGSVTGAAPTTVTIGNFTVTSTATTIPFQTFATGPLLLTVNGTGPYTYTYTISVLQ